MPGMSGFEVPSKLRADKKTGRIPVIMITAYEKNEDRVKALESGKVRRKRNTSIFFRTREKNRELQEALDNAKTISGMLPICASCKKIRDDKGYWSGVESYTTKHSEVLFSHGICPECEKKMNEDLEKLKKENL
jgi:CheY-like chemotaxis protein